MLTPYERNILDPRQLNPKPLSPEPLTSTLNPLPLKSLAQKQLQLAAFLLDSGSKPK